MANQDRRKWGWVPFFRRFVPTDHSNVPTDQDSVSYGEAMRTKLYERLGDQHDVICVVSADKDGKRVIFTRSGENKGTRSTATYTKNVEISEEEIRRLSPEELSKKICI